MYKPSKYYAAEKFRPLVAHFDTLTPHLYELFLSRYEEPTAEEHEKCQKAAIKITKLLINSMIGMFGRRDTSRWMCQMTPTNEEICLALPHAHNPRVVSFDEKERALRVVVSETKTVNMTQSFYPLFLQICDLEALYLYRQQKILRECGAIPVYVKTDAVGYLAPNRIVPDVYYDKEEQIPMFWRPLDFRGNETWDKFAFPLRQCIQLCTDTSNVRDQDWQFIEEDDDFVRLAEDMQTYCVLLNSSPGTGKTTLTQECIRLALRMYEDEDRKLGTVAIFTPTWAACNNIGFGAKTCAQMKDRWLRQPDSFETVRLLVVDEFSMLCCEWLSVLMQIKIRYPHIRFLISGDQFQLPAVCDWEQGENVRNCNRLMQSHVLRFLTSHQLNMKRCRRKTDDRGGQVLFEEVDNVKQTGKCDTSKFAGPVLGTGVLTHTAVNLCSTNRRRQEINHFVNTQFIQQNNLTNLVFIPQFRGEPKWHLGVGMRLIAKISVKNNDKETRAEHPTLFATNEMFRCIAISEDKETITIQREGGDEVLDIKTPNFKKQFRLAWAITIHASQGVTLDEAYTIHEWSSLHKTLRYVALSRGRSADNVCIRGVGK